MQFTALNITKTSKHFILIFHFRGRKLSLCIQAATIKYYKLVFLLAYKQQKLLSHGSGGWEVQDQVPLGSLTFIDGAPACVLTWLKE